MRQPIKFLPYLKTTAWGGEEISRFKGLKINCKNIGESWELSGVEGCESIVMDGDDCGMTLADMVSKYKERLVGRSVYNRYGDTFPLVVKFVNAADELSVQMSTHETDEGCRYCPSTGAVASGRLHHGAALQPGGDQQDEAALQRVDFVGLQRGAAARGVGGAAACAGEVETEQLMSCGGMRVRKETVAGERRLTNRDDSFMGVVCVGGNGCVKVDGISTSVRQGETLLIPAHTEEFDVEGTMALLTVVIPTLMANAEA